MTLPDPTWALWRWVCVRGAGFPAALSLRLACPDLGRAADALVTAEAAADDAQRAVLASLRGDMSGLSHEDLVAARKARKKIEKGKVPEVASIPGVPDGELEALRAAVARVEASRQAVASAFDDARPRVTAALREVAADPRFREAVTWQNRHAAETAVAGVARIPAGATPTASRDRQHEELVVNYLHRYSTKNDTIGFFGPVGWARLEPSSEPLVVRPGPGLVRKRTVSFEQWGIDTLARVLSEAPGARRWQAPHRFGFLRIEGNTVHNPMAGRQDLSDAQLAVLRACDGEKLACELAADLVRESPALLPDEEAVLRVLGDLAEKKLIAWTFEFRTTWQPERELRERLAKIGDDELRARSTAALDELDAARRRVADAASDPHALNAAIGEVESVFSRLTGASPTRHAGAMYASRGLLFEDCQRDLDMTIGPRVLEQIGPALALVLKSARWLTFETGRAYRAAFGEVYAELARRAGSPSIPFADFWFRAQRLIHGAKGRPIDAVARDLGERWARILAVPEGQRRVDVRSDAIAARVAEAFDAPRAGWMSARHHSPDVMIAARSIDDITRGEYLAVLGEVHVALNTMTTRLWVDQHPAPEDLRLAMARDLPEPQAYRVGVKYSPRSSTVRSVDALSADKDYELETAFESSARPPDRRLRLGELVLEEIDGALKVRTSDGRAAWDIVDFVGVELGELVTNHLPLLPGLPRAPRLTLDRVVVAREKWRFAPAELTFAYGATEVDRFVGARRWARANGLPRFVFVRSSLEVKPIYVDFESPPAVAIFGKLVRHAKEHVSGSASLTATEMIPDLEHTWLPDADGRRYTCELRFVAVDQLR